MIDIKKFVVNMLSENCYVVSDETKECMIVDCGASCKEEVYAITNYIKENNLQPKHLVATHGHVDHNWGDWAMTQEYGLNLEISERDEDLVKQLERQEKMLLGRRMTDCPPPQIGRLFDDGDKIELGNHEFRIISTPGHSEGSCFILCDEEKVAFSGDTLFRESIGRTDFIGGSQFMIIMSLRQICQMDDSIRVLPGHGEETTIGWECAHNMYIDR